MRIAKLAELAAQIDTPRPFLEKIRVAEQERDALLEQLAEAEATQEAAAALDAISPADVRAILAGLAEHLEAADREGLKDFLTGLIERIDLTADGSECVIHYRIHTGDKLASPRRGKQIPDLRLARAFKVSSQQRRPGTRIGLVGTSPKVTRDSRRHGKGPGSKVPSP